MKYLITESKLESVIINYLDEIFPVENVNQVHPYEYNDETGEEGEDEDRREFYLGDYDDGDNTCFRWYGCNYFYWWDEDKVKCPIVSMEVQYSNLLNGYFGDTWEEPFKIWFTKNFDLPIKSVE
jgi:hypothetical protein